MNDNINAGTLETEAKDIALAAIAEEREYNADGHQLMHEACDGHAWVIYNYKAQQLCYNCCTDWGEDYLEECGMTEWNSLQEHTCAVAYATLLAAATEQYNTLKEDIDAAQESNQ
jgi:hypothetical protein